MTFLPDARQLLNKNLKENTILQVVDTVKMFWGSPQFSLYNSLSNFYEAARIQTLKTDPVLIKVIEALETESKKSGLIASVEALYEFKQLVGSCESSSQKEL